MSTQNEAAPGAQEPADPKAPSEPHVSFRRAALVAALGPAAWFVDLSTRFFLVEFGFARQNEGWVIAIGAAFCGVAIASGLASKRLRVRARGQPGEAEFAALLGVALGAFSALAIAASLVPHVFLDGGSPP